ncbi:MAG: transposase [Parabacteroides merdae]
MFWSCPLSANTQEYYAKEGQTSFDPVVFFKLMLIGYLENIPSDSKIVEQAGMRLDMLYFFTIILTSRFHGTVRFSVPVNFMMRSFFEGVQPYSGVVYKDRYG